jgi:hypothetical protein
MNVKMLKAVLAGLILSVSAFANAGLIITIGDVTGNNTNLSVSVEGSGTLVADIWSGGPGGLNVYTDFIGTTDSSTSLVGLVGDQVGFFADNNIGNYVGTTYSSFTAEKLISGIELFNLTDNTSALINWLDIDDDGAGDDFALILDTIDNSFLDSGDSWSINGTSFLNLQLGNASDFSIGTYSYTDNALGVVTLVIQENSVNVPEPSTLAIFALSIMGLAARRFKKQ